MELKDLYPTKSRVLLIGTYPPPLGGVSVHIYRLKKVLIEKKCQVHIFDLSKKFFPGDKIIRLTFILLFIRWDIVHIHSSVTMIINLARIIKTIKQFKIFFTDHNPRLFHDRSTKEVIKIRQLVYSMDVLILVTQQIYQNYKDQEIPLPDRWFIKEAFLPPPLEEESSITAIYPEELQEFLEKNSPILFANAYQLNFFQNSDLYGLDLCVDLIDRLVKTFPNIGFLFALANSKYNQEYFQKIISEIEQKKLTSHFYFLTGQHQIWPLYKSISLFIRPTKSDGDAISIREALFFNIKVIASDTCSRPKECITFITRDIDDLYYKTLSILQSNIKT